MEAGLATEGVDLEGEVETVGVVVVDVSGEEAGEEDEEAGR